MTREGEECDEIEETPRFLTAVAMASSARPFWSSLRRQDPTIAQDERQFPLLAKQRSSSAFSLTTSGYVISDIGWSVEEILFVVNLETTLHWDTWICKVLSFRQDTSPGSPTSSIHQPCVEKGRTRPRWRSAPRCSNSMPHT